MHNVTDQTGLTLSDSAWPAANLEGTLVTRAAAQEIVDRYADRIRWAADDELDPDDVTDARWVAEELEQDGTPYSWTYRGNDLDQLERDIVTWAMTEDEEPRGVGGRNWLRITDRLA